MPCNQYRYESQESCKDCPDYMDTCDGKEEDLECPNCGISDDKVTTNSSDQIMCNNCGYDETGDDK